MACRAKGCKDVVAIQVQCANAMLLVLVDHRVPKIQQCITTYPVHKTCKYERNYLASFLRGVAGRGGSIDLHKLFFPLKHFEDNEKGQLAFKN